MYLTQSRARRRFSLFVFVFNEIWTHALYVHIKRSYRKFYVHFSAIGT